MKVYFGLKIENKKTLPKKGAIILASNHVSFIDSLISSVSSRRPIKYIGKAEYFLTDTFKHKFIAWFMTNIGVIPVDRKGGKAAENAIKEAEKVLNNGGVFCIYPEGTRSPDGVLYKGHTGIARIALATKTDILPIAMIDTWKANPVGKGFKFRQKCGAKFGEIIKIDEYLNQEVTKELLREITNRVMESLRDLSGQAYNPSVYGSVKRNELKDLKVYGK